MKQSAKVYIPKIGSVEEAANRLQGISLKTPLMHSYTYSELYDAEVLLKREDLQQVRSYKIRGAFNKIASLSETEKQLGIVCASAGNHAQGVALSCAKLGIKGTIFMPTPTPKQKLQQVAMFGKNLIDIQLVGDTFDDSYQTALEHCKKYNKVFVHPFDDEKVIEGQATVGLEILKQTQKIIDYAFVPVGGGGLIAGFGSVFNQLSPSTKIIGVEPAGAPTMKISLEQKQRLRLSKIDKFVDGAAVQQVGVKSFAICQQLSQEVVAVSEGKICQTILDLYNKDAIVVEPAGALSLTALDHYKEEIKGKTVVCIVSGSNNDIARMAEIKERALLYAKLKHYFIIRFPQRAGALKEFVAEILGPNDDITHFEYSKKHSRENGPAIVGIELKQTTDFKPLLERMKKHNFYGDYLNDKPDLFQYLIL